MAIRTAPVFLLGFLALPAMAYAAPFCIESQALSPICIYYDAASCQKEANRQGGVCSANPNEVKLSSNVGQYCLVTSDGSSQCIYSDRGSCATDAVREHGACTSSPILAPSGAPDPYSAIGGR